MRFLNINRRFNTADEYREEIEKASAIIRGTPSEAIRQKWIRKRFRLEKEYFSLLFNNICYTEKDNERRHLQ